jgi:hypothetical protein
MKIQVEKTAMAAAVALLVALVVSYLSRFGNPAGISIGFAIMTVIGLILRIGCAWWLNQKNRRQQFPWLWCLLGLAFGLMAVALYYLVEIHRKVSLLQGENEEP